MKTLALAVALLVLAVPAAATAHSDRGAWWTTPRAAAAIATMKYKMKGDRTVYSYGDTRRNEIKCKPLAPTQAAPYTGYLIATHFRCEIWAAGGWGVRGPIFRLHALRGNYFSVDELWKPSNVADAGLE